MGEFSAPRPALSRLNRALFVHVMQEPPISTRTNRRLLLYFLRYLPAVELVFEPSSHPAGVFKSRKALLMTWIPGHITTSFVYS